MKKRLFRCSGLIMAICFTIFALALDFEVSSADASVVDSPEFVSIGLKFSGAAAELSNVKSEDDICIAAFDDYGEEFIFNIAENDIAASRDTYYHIQLEEEFDDASDVLQIIDDMDIEGAYPYFDGKDWYLNIGRFGDEDSANEELDDLEDDGLEYDADVVMADGTDILITYREDAVLGYDSSKDIVIKSLSNLPIWIDGKRYRGGAVFRRMSDGKITVINRVRLEEYLYGVVPNEAYTTWPIESLKAQAVAARNYTVISMGKHKSEGFDLCGTTHCQMYGGYGTERSSTNRAVEETRGKFMTYDGKVVSAFFHSNSGGRTEDSENVWSAELPYIRGVEDEYSVGEPKSSWNAQFTSEQVRSKLSAAGVDIGDIEDMKIGSLSENGRVTELEVIGSYGEKTLQKDAIRKTFGYNVLMSTYFSMSSKPTEAAQKNMSVLSANNKTSLDMSSLKMVSSDRRVSSVKSGEGISVISAYSSQKITPEPQKMEQFTFEGKGWGHGLGMSQWGARKMAELGYGYEDILKHYYTGVEIEE
ncbi:stage II sporulation protein D [Peptoclostridium litorale DSM 5388]|uniref:Amidase enhancer n=2 Tax=Peptoclostridium litorale TaxID=1557 RepID=A0A069RGE4_PEPLI|nr:SpoIID/LytB domain-containing protein [Peptoclostridium litorale]KDR96081.1 amidase enhancer [Peptoclostridium litorale DSM 5388]SIO05110.1 stage II sporulation protein D [Peptoclostridium litorale DSM 5388]